MLFFVPILAAVCALAAAGSSTVAPYDPTLVDTTSDTSQYAAHYSRLLPRTITGTGCTCAGLRYANSRLWNYVPIVVLYSVALGNPNGWCWQNGVMPTAFSSQVLAGITAKKVTPYVNGTWANEICKADCTTCTTAAQCTTFIINMFTNKATNADLNACTYPSANFVPIDCTCGFNCTNSFTKCGASSCMNPVTQTCVSGLPRPKPALKRSVMHCDNGLTPCPLVRGYECLNTTSNLEACGGCPFAYAGGAGNQGTDCSAIPGVDRVDCVNGACHVHACMKGYTYQNGQCR